MARLERKLGGGPPRVRGAQVGHRSRGLGWRTYAAIAPMLAIAVLSGGFRLGVIPTSLFGSAFQPVLERMFSRIPSVPGVDSDQMAAMRAAAGLDSKQLGLSVAFVQEEGHYAMVAASNLPDGAVLRVGIRGAAEPAMEVTFPLTILGGMAKSRALQDMKGRPLTPGRYQVFVVDGEEAEQSPGALARLRALPADAAHSGVGRLPAGMPSNRRFTWMEERSVR